MNAAAKLLLAVGTSAAYWLLLRGQVRAPASTRVLLGANFLVKAAVFVVFYVWIDHGARGDLAQFYLPQAHAVLAGQVPHRDFVSSYGVLFPYFLGALETGLGLPSWYLLLIVADTWLLSRLLLEAGELQGNVFWLWLSCPLLIWNVPVEGQQQILLGVGFLAILALLEARRPIASAAVLVGSMAALKILLAPLVAPLVFGRASRITLAWLAATLGLLMIAIAAHAALGLNPLRGIAYEAQNTFPGSILFWVWTGFAWSRRVIPLLNLASLAVAFAAAGAYRWRHPDGDLMSLGTVFALVYFALGPRTYVVYLVIVLPVALIALARRDDTLGLVGMAIICALASAEFSVWFHLGMPMSFSGHGAALVAFYDAGLSGLELALAARMCGRVLYPAVIRPAEARSPPSTSCATS